MLLSLQASGHTPLLLLSATSFTTCSPRLSAQALPLYIQVHCFHSLITQNDHHSETSNYVLHGIWEPMLAGLQDRIRPPAFVAASNWFPFPWVLVPLLIYHTHLSFSPMGFFLVLHKAQCVDSGSIQAAKQYRFVRYGSALSTYVPRPHPLSIAMFCCCYSPLRLWSHSLRYSYFVEDEGNHTLYRMPPGLVSTNDNGSANLGPEHGRR